MFSSISSWVSILIQILASQFGVPKQMVFPDVLRKFWCQRKQKKTDSDESSVDKKGLLDSI